MGVAEALMAPVMMLVFYFMDQAFWPVFATEPYGFVYMGAIVMVEGISIMTMIGLGGGRRR